MSEFILSVLRESSLPPEQVGLATEAVEFSLLCLLAWLAHTVTVKLARSAARRAASATPTRLHDRIMGSGVLRSALHVVPASMLYTIGPLVLSSPAVSSAIMRGAEAYALIALAFAANKVLTVARDVYEGRQAARRFPIRAHVQAARIALIVGTALLTVAILTGKSPVLLLGGLGAAAAVLLLVFKDTLQSLAAGVQLVYNDMVRPDDWVEIPQHGADGSVQEITLHTVKVQNWDNTVSMVPTFAMVSQGFKNWRGMAESGGRRIKRSVHIDVSSVRFCEPELLERCRQIQILKDYIDSAEAEIEEHNRVHGIDPTNPANGRRLTNLGIFRNYLIRYLQAHPMINQDLIVMVRHLQPTARGLPVEIYAFASDKRWVRYEEIQADILDHVHAVLPLFDLRAFQSPAGADVSAVAGCIKGERLVARA